MISIENLTKSYGGHLLLDGVSFRINAKERVGVVGRNGHGKTTLFKMITGEANPDEGAITVPKNYRIGHVSQQLDFREKTVLDEGMGGLPATEQDHYWKVEKILFGLGFTADDMQRRPAEFSGGYQVRLNLAKVLVAEPDLLLLDEPTNYLDITSIRWITRFLVNWPRELMLITHDRGFMDGIVTHTVGIHRKKIRKFAGNTEKYYAQIAQDEEIYEKTRLNDEKRRKEVELFITRFRAKARLANLVQSRIKTLAKMEKRDKLETLKTLDFSFRAEPFAGRQVLRVEKLSFGYEPGQPIIRGLTAHVGTGERLCIIGKNGKGKTTLLKLLAQRLSPDAGTIAYNPNVTMGVFEQTHIKSLVESRTIEEELLYSHPDVDRQTARNACGAMMFSGDDALKKIGVLSGGEKSRVMLAKLLVTPANLLLLDEPTNHLDMDACDALLAAIDNFAGTVIMVTHNEMFLHALAEKLIVFRDEGPFLFNGTYQDFLEKGGWEEHGPVSGIPDVIDESGPPRVQRPKKEIRRLRSEIVTEKGKTLKPLEEGIQRIESAIENKEAEIDGCNRRLVSAAQSGEGAKIAELSRELHAGQTAVEALYDQLASLTEKLEHKSAEFDQRLAALETDGNP